MSPVKMWLLLFVQTQILLSYAMHPEQNSSLSLNFSFQHFFLTECSPNYLIHRRRSLLHFFRILSVSSSLLNDWYQVLTFLQ